MLGALGILACLIPMETVNVWKLLWNKPSVSQSEKRGELQLTEPTPSSATASNEGAIMRETVKAYFFIRAKLACLPPEAWALACAVTHPAREIKENPEIGCYD